MTFDELFQLAKFVDDITPTSRSMSYVQIMPGGLLMGFRTWDEKMERFINSDQRYFKEDLVGSDLDFFKDEARRILDDLTFAKKDWDTEESVDV